VDVGSFFRDARMLSANWIRGEIKCSTVKK